MNFAIIEQTRLCPYKQLNKLNEVELIDTREAQESMLSTYLWPYTAVYNISQYKSL